MPKKNGVNQPKRRYPESEKALQSVGGDLNNLGRNTQKRLKH